MTHQEALWPLATCRRPMSCVGQHISIPGREKIRCCSSHGMQEVQQLQA
jgi:hypothetical protein